MSITYNCSLFSLTFCNSHRPRVELPIRIVLVHPRRLNSQMLPAPDEETGKRQDKDANSADGVENIGHPDCCNPSRHGKDKDSAEGIPDGCQSR